MTINEAKPAQLDAFFSYLNRQLAANSGPANPLFQPLAKEHCHVSESVKKKFIHGFDYQLGQPGWRKLWLALDDTGKIMGHIDLRHYSEGYKAHRLLLGMGVDCSVRQQGLGQQLLQRAIHFCRESPSIDWLDLHVLSENTPAKKLYLKTGFSIAGEVIDCYRIDGNPVAETSMILNTRA